jgi:hypothetical protein
MLRNRVETIKGYTHTHAMDGSGIYLIRQMMTDLDADGICCEFGSGSFKIIVDGETVISNNGVSESVQETFIMPEYEVAYEVRNFESRIRAAHVSLA